MKFQNSVPTSQKEHCVNITNNSHLMLFRETVASYFKNHMNT
jgi:hypothetical protein